MHMCLQVANLQSGRPSMQRTTIDLVLYPPMWRIIHDQEDRKAADNNPPRLRFSHYTIQSLNITKQL